MPALTVSFLTVNGLSFFLTSILTAMVVGYEALHSTVNSDLKPSVTGPMVLSKSPPGILDRRVEVPSSVV